MSPAAYAENARSHETKRDAETRRSLLISRLRLATFLPAAACMLSIAGRGTSPLLTVVTIVLLVAFVALVVWHGRVEERAAWYEALRLVNMRAIARVARDWSTLPPADPPAGHDLFRHPYAIDLDLFGRASLFQWLGPAATVMGSRMLATWLLQPAPRSEILERQQGLAQLAPWDGWREQFAARGVLAAGARHEEIDRFIAWANGGDVFGRRAPTVRAAVYILTASIWTLLTLQITGVIPEAIWLIPVVPGMVLSFAASGRIQNAFDHAGGGEYALSPYAALFAHALAVPGSSSLLDAIRDRLSADGLPAPVWMRRLNRILGFGALRRGAAILHFPIQAMTQWDFHVVFALDRWRRHAGRSVHSWLLALAELDALAALATARRDNPTWCAPDVTNEPVFDAASLGHPLIADDRRVANDVQVGPPRTILLVTGSNMSGKSTLLRAIGLNIVLAQAGACACATRLRLPEADLQTCIRVQDSLELGLSYFTAALARLKGVVDAAEHERPGRVLVYLLDEILQGTNSAERSIAVRAVARHLLEADAIGAMTTHDLTLAGEEPLKQAARLVHFTETVDEDGAMTFDYHLRPGLATSRNALRLMKLIGIEI